MKKVLFTFLAIFTMLTAYAQFPGWGPQSKVVTDSIYSKILDANRQFTIYLTPTPQTRWLC